MRFQTALMTFLSIVLTVVFYVFNSVTVKCFAATENSVIVPRLTEIPAVVTMELSSQSLFQGQNVSVTVSNNFYYNNSLVVPLGSSINGTVIMAQKADKYGKDGKLSILFTNITTPYGNVVPISGMLKTDDNSGIVYGNVTKDNTNEIAKGAVKGAAVGSYIDGVCNNNTIKTGTAIGAGMAASSGNKGVFAIIPVGTIVSVVLNQQSTFNAVQGYQY